MMVVLVIVYSMVTAALVGFFDRLCDVFSGAFFFGDDEGFRHICH